MIDPFVIVWNSPIKQTVILPNVDQASGLNHNIQRILIFLEKTDKFKIQFPVQLLFAFHNSLLNLIELCFTLLT